MNYMILMNIATFLVMAYIIYSYFLYKNFFLNPMFFFLLGYLLFLGFPALIRDDQTIFDERYLYLSCITFLNLFGFLFGWFLYLQKKRIFKQEFNLSDKLITLTVKYRFIIITIFIIAVLMQYFSLRAVGIPMVAKLIAMRSGIDTAQNIYTTFYRFPYTFSFSIINTTSLILLIDAFNRKYSISYKVILLLIFTIAFLINFGTGNRMQTFVFVMPFILYYMFLVYGKISIKKIIFISMIAIFMFTAVLIQSNIRNSGISSLGEQNLDSSEIITHGLDQAPGLLKIFDDYPERKDFILGESFLALLVNPIPREFFPGKPVGIGAIVGDVDLVTRRGISISITIFGELYVNFGYFGFLLAVVFGFFMKMWFVYFLKNINNLKIIILYFHSLPFFTIEFRGGFLSQSMMYLMQLAMLLLIFKLIPKVGKQK
ncbi:MAG: oligosaccharide repeat unit polymerase [Bacteroidales bacterium]|nr:oligosaccharide repeat unit polymerase [Bacteroidales bacterium]